MIGMIQDSVNLRPVVFAAVSAIRKSDSVLVKTTRTNQQGRFSLKPLAENNYIILVAHNSFVDYVDEVEIKANKPTTDIGKINLFSRGQLLKEVVIKNAAGIKIKGDTLEYSADSFKVRKGAMVEDLLKVLPGIQVNKKGEITAMGEKVEKVLVDGEEFFGDDPTVATQNLQSQIVEKVQVFDKKSDQAKFTGFDDGNTEKTINLKLKKGMNKGEFGKLEMAGGWKDNWQNQAMLNVFRDKEKFSLYGLMSSIGKTGLGWDDRNAYTGQAENMQMSEDGGMYTMSDGGDEGGNTYNNGIQEGMSKAWVGGLHYSNRWNEDKEHTNVNYSFGRINKTKRETSLTENLFPQNRYQSVDTSNSFNSRNAHRLSGKYDFAIDTNTTIIYNFSGRLSFVDNNSFSKTENKTYSDDPISNSQRDNNTHTVNTSAGNSITVNHKLKKYGRTISLFANYDYSKNESLGTLEGENNYFIGGINKNEILDQQKTTVALTNSANASLTFTEPLSKKIQLKLSYNIGTDRNNSLKETNVKTNSDEYTEQIDSLSNDFSSVVNTHTGGVEFKYNEKKYSLALGSRVRYSKFNQQDIIRLYHYNYNRINLFPTLRFNYKFNQFNRVNFSYSGNTTQPSITQIQPYQDNSNPLQITIGNPNLKIGYSQNINLNFFNYKVLSARSIYAGVYASNKYNNVTTNRTFDELGRTINEYVNINGFYSVSMWAGFSSRIPKSKFEGKINLNGNLTHNPNITNNIKGVTTNYSLTLTPGLTYSKENSIYSSFEIGTIYTNSKSTFQNAREIKFISLNPTFSLIKYFKDLEIGSDVDYIYNPPVAPYPNKFERFIWNAYVTYKVLPKKNLDLKFSINDILNQNRGYERTTTNNYNTERNFLTLGRYWMVGFVYNFKHGAMAEAKGKPGKMPPMGGRPPRGSGGGRRR